MPKSPARQKNVDYDFELASAPGFGEAYGKRLVEALGGKGEYAVFVGPLIVPLHDAWADVAIAYLKANAPSMTLVGDRYGVAGSVQTVGVGTLAGVPARLIVLAAAIALRFVVLSRTRLGCATRMIGSNIGATRLPALKPGTYPMVVEAVNEYGRTVSTRLALEVEG